MTSHSAFRPTQSSAPGSIRPISMSEWTQTSSDEAVSSRKKEMEVFLGLIRIPSFLHDHTTVFLSPDYGRPEFGAWWASSQRNLLRFLYHNDHKINGKWGNWSNGGMGSRWCDVRINGYDIRIAYYSKATNGSMFKKLPESMRKDHILMITDYFEGKDECGEHPTAPF